MTDTDILSLAYQRQNEGDRRPLGEIIASVRVDVAGLHEVDPASVAGHVVIIMPNGNVERSIIYGDGRVDSTFEQAE